MYSYRYKHGDKPLDGYTIERAAGRGGFGEVYYAISDSGREVALKSVQGYEQIELRGISQCMNLKSPHLVSIFDVKFNSENRPFVIMEFVSGLNLRELIDQSPGGLGEAKAAFFLREIGKGLTYLHDCGIVHRDLKPANIFYENGYVKIGDYGLSKAISTSQHSGQTVTVGTVHYMAPEVGAGKYDRSIDIYALGAVLFEMLTGMPPFIGASASEVLMKHLSAEPDLKGISEPFASTIKKAMAKDPKVRFQTVQELVESVFGSDHVRQSMSVFSPNDLTMVAGRVAGGVGTIGTTIGSQPASSRIGGLAVEAPPMPGERGFPTPPGGSRPSIIPTLPVFEPPHAVFQEIGDPLPARDRFLLAGVVCLLFATAAGYFGSSDLLGPGQAFWFTLLAIVGQSIGLRVSMGLTHRLGDTPGFRRLLTAGVIFGISMALTAAVAPWMNGMPPTLLACAAPLAILDVRRWVALDRTRRLHIGPAIGAAAMGFVAANFLHGTPALAIATVAGFAVVSQLLYAWNRDAGFTPLPQPGGASSGSPPVETAQEMGNRLKQWGEQQRQQWQERAEQQRQLWEKRTEQFRERAEQWGKSPAAAGSLSPAAPSAAKYWSIPVPFLARIGWIAGIAVFFTTMLSTFIVAGTGDWNDAQFANFISWGLVSTGMFLTCLVRVWRGRFYGWEHYLVRPLAVGILPSIAAAWIANMALKGNPSVPLIFLSVLFPVLALVLMFIPLKKKLSDQNAPTALPIGDISTLERPWALVYCSLAFCGICGIQRMYAGKYGTGILWLCTGGLLGVGQLIDAIMILSGTFTDASGRRLVLWNWNVPWDGTQVPGVAGMRAAAAAAAGGVPWQMPKRRESLTARFGGLLLMVALLLGIGLALHVPDALAAGLPLPAARNQLNQFFGYAEWPGLLTRLTQVAALLLLTSGATAAVWSRRHDGALHMVRGLIGVGAIFLAINAGQHIFEGSVWQSAAPQLQPGKGQMIGPGLDNLLNHAHGDAAAGSALALLAGTVMLAYPPRRQIPQANPRQQEVAAS